MHSKTTYCLLTPQFAPNIQDFFSMLKADRVLWLDEATWSRKGRTHRSLIRENNEEIWLRIPVRTEDKKKSIRQVRIDHEADWTLLFWKNLEHIFSQYTYFDYFEDEIKSILNSASNFEKLIDFNNHFYQTMCAFLEVDIEIDLQSEVGLIDTPFYFESESKNYLPQPDNILHYQPNFMDFKTDQSILHLLFAFGPEFFNISDSI